MHDPRRHPQGNPVGPEEPLVKLDVSMWQVYLALLLIAGVLTAFKVYERTTLAPRQPVVWQPLPLRDLLQERRMQRNLIIWVKGSDTVADNLVRDLSEQPDVRAALYLNRFQSFEVQWSDLGGEVDESVVRELQPVAAGGLAIWHANKPKPVCLPPATLDPQTVLDHIDSAE